jgi:hypothetical protein
MAQSRRVFLTIPTGIADALERWADAEGDKVATLAGYIVTKAVREAIADGRVPPATSFKSISHAIVRNWDHLVKNSRIPKERLLAIRDGDCPSDLEYARLALALKVTEEELESLPLSHKGGKSNGTANGVT